MTLLVRHKCSAKWFHLLCAVSFILWEKMVEIRRCRSLKKTFQRAIPKTRYASFRNLVILNYALILINVSIFLRTGFKVRDLIFASELLVLAGQYQYTAFRGNSNCSNGRGGEGVNLPGSGVAEGAWE